MQWKCWVSWNRTVAQYLSISEIVEHFVWRISALRFRSFVQQSLKWTGTGLNCSGHIYGGHLRAACTSSGQSCWRDMHYLHLLAQCVQTWLSRQACSLHTSQYHLNISFNSYFEVNECFIYLLAIISSPCCYIQHSVGSITSCIKIPHESYTFETSFHLWCMMSLWKAKKILWHKFQDVNSSSRKTIHTFINTLWQTGSVLNKNEPNQNFEYSLKRIWMNQWYTLTFY